MIEIPKSCEITADKAGKTENPGPAGPADAHAMKALMNRQGAAGELSAIFSAQLSRRTSGGKKAGQRPGDAAGRRKPAGGQDPAPAGTGRDAGDAPDQDTLNPYTIDQDASDLAREVAEHILVSDPEYLEPGTGSEVRIKIKARILKGAHIRMKTMSDHLKVRLVTTDAGSARILEKAEPALASRLKTHFSGRIDIKTVYMPKEEAHDRP